MTHFIKCANCGIYFDSSGGGKTLYCSESCSQKYSSCRNCGRYFEKKSSSPYCSGECSTIYKITTHGEKKR